MFLEKVVPVILGRKPILCFVCKYLNNIIFIYIYFIHIYIYVFRLPDLQNCNRKNRQVDIQLMSLSEIMLTDHQKRKITKTEDN